MHSRRMCLHYYILGFTAHFIISGVDCASDHDCCDDDEDRYNYLGYDTDYEECADEYYA